VRITDINNRKMEVIVNEDQLSLAIGKRGQNVRLATRLVGWDIDIVSEELLKKEIAKQMGKMMASGEAVPITALQGVTAGQAETLKDKGIADVEKLAATSVDDLVDILDLSLDEAEKIINSAKAIVEARNSQAETSSEEESAATVEADAQNTSASAGETENESSNKTGENDNSSAATKDKVGTPLSDQVVDTAQEDTES
jgi:N utilization substance protein A